MSFLYPNQITKPVYGNGVSLNVSVALVEPQESNGTPPLYMTEPGLARAIFTLLQMNDSAAATAITCSIQFPDISYLQDMTRISMAKIVDSKLSKNVSVKSVASIANSVKLPFGKVNGQSVSGKTPANVLTENPEAKADLEKMIPLLEKNASTYPQNQKIADGIREAIKLLEEGKLSDGEPSSNTSGSEFGRIEILDDPIHYGRGQTSDGYKEITGIKIYCDCENKYPFTVEITSMEAPLKKGANGSTLPELSKRRNVKSAAIHMSAKDWKRIISELDDIKKMFKSGNWDKMYARSQALTKANIEEYRKSQAKS